MTQKIQNCRDPFHTPNRIAKDQSAAYMFSQKIIKVVIFFFKFARNSTLRQSGGSTYKVSISNYYRLRCRFSLPFLSRVISTTLGSVIPRVSIIFCSFCSGVISEIFLLFSNFFFLAKCLGNSCISVNVAENTKFCLSLHLFSSILSLSKMRCSSWKCPFSNIRSVSSIAKNLTKKTEINHFVSKLPN